MMQARWTQIAQIWQDNRWLYVLAGLLLGILITPAIEQITGDLNNLIGNLVPEAISVIFTVLILDRLADNRATEELKRRLVREADSRDNSTAISAVDWMRAAGWLTIHDSVALLQGADLSYANLNTANLHQANLEDVNLLDSRLQEARINDANLKGANLGYARLQNTNLWHTNLEKANLFRAFLGGTDLSEANLKGANLEQAIFDEKTILPEAIALMETDEIYAYEDGYYVYDKYWTPGTDMARYTDPNRPGFWQPDWVKAQNKD